MRALFCKVSWFITNKKSFAFEVGFFLLEESVSSGGASFELVF